MINYFKIKWIVAVNLAVNGPAIKEGCVFAFFAHRNEVKVVAKESQVQIVRVIKRYIF
jgi:hypothetical protein